MDLTYRMCTGLCEVTWILCSRFGDPSNPALLLEVLWKPLTAVVQLQASDDMSRRSCRIALHPLETPFAMSDAQREAAIGTARIDIDTPGSSRCQLRSAEPIVPNVWLVSILHLQTFLLFNFTFRS
jgi:hypothetical protein